jgi:hypothetical protein
VPVVPRFLDSSARDLRAFEGKSFVILYPFEDQIAMPLKSTKCIFKRAEHRYGDVNFVPVALQLFDLLFLVGDMLLRLCDVAIGLR